MLVKLNGQNFKVNSNEFKVVYNKIYNNLEIIPELGVKERIISLLIELQTIFKHKINIIFYGISHGGFIPIKCSPYFNNIYVIEQNIENIKYNIEFQNINNIFLNKQDTKEPFILYVENDDDYEYISSIVNQKNIIVVSKFLFQKEYEFKLTNSDFNIYIPQVLYEKFYQEFHFFIKDNFVLDYDNLIHLSMIVKNGGKDFEEMLTRNINLFDRWTILDTGSTDNTIEIINKVLVGKKKGELFQEPFINFRESRNRCLDLCGQKCKFIIILDDTYVAEGKLREFLNIVRGDQFSSSFSLYIKSNDTEYCSNRIIKSENNLRYIYKIHEVIQGKNNTNVCVPLEQCYINDLRSEYMEKRTIDRKQFDLKLLFEMIEEEPDNPRHLYYIAHTYNLLEKYELAYEYFLKRAKYNTGFIQEQIDSYFEAARLANFKLNKDWKTCFDLYLKSYELDKTRPDSMYFIGIHYYLQEDKETAFKYFKTAFEIGYPIHAQHSLKPTLSYHFLPKFLCELCYIFKDYELGLKSASLFLEKNKQTEDYFMVMKSWYDIYKKLNEHKINKNLFTFVNNNVKFKPILCFIADGGFNKWSGSSITKRGVGGSETFIIEMSKYLSRNFDVYVFCNCEEDEIYESVQYFHLSKLYSFLSANHIHTCIVSRYTEYLPVCYENDIDNIYLSLHDLLIDGTVIPVNSKLKNVFCLSESHLQHFVEIFPCFKNITKSFNYGIDEIFFFNEQQNYKIKNKFIYSSFPNRGLIQLFNMWEVIRTRLKDATLHLYFDIDNTWVNENWSEDMKLIKEYLKTHNEKDGIYYHGWVDKKTLSEAWKTSSIWLYPCTFVETFCLTALECAASKTLCITTDIGSLKETAKNGIIIKGSPDTEEWKTKALEKLFSILENENQILETIEKNYSWAKTMIWKNRVSDFIKLLEPFDLFDYQNLYNWTNDLPKGSKKIFEDILSYHSKKYLNNQCKILEIGTYTGTSLIQIMKYFQNPKATVIDSWKNYNEENNKIPNKNMENIEQNNIKNVFINNIIKANIFDKVTMIHEDSNLALKHMMNNYLSNSFDLIYIDGSHKLLESYTDIIFSHFLLNKNGLLIIDDVYYNKSNILESPLKGIEYFLEKFGNSYKILNSGYRLFLEKI